MKMCAAILSYLIHCTEPLNSSRQREGDLSHMHNFISFDRILHHLLHLLQLLHSDRVLRNEISHLQEKCPKRYRTKERELGQGPQATQLGHTTLSLCFIFPTCKREL